MITQTPFSLYVSSVFNASNWLTGVAYGLQATGVIVSAPSGQDGLKHTTYLTHSIEWWGSLRDVLL